MIDYSSLPDKPGCYLFKDRKDIILYVGKAKSLKKRVSSYFTKSNHDPKTAQLIKHAAKIDYIATNNEVEALILENTLIKKHRPKYNIDLKDSKRYAYLMLTDEDYPRLVLKRNRQMKGRMFGPFTSGQQRNYIMQLLQRTFKLRTCKKMPKRACLRHHIGLCSGVCIDAVSKSAYNEKISKAIKILKGNTEQLIKDLEKDMEDASKKLDFEKAMELRDELDALKYLKEKQAMERQKRYDEDVINYIIKEGRVYLLLFNIYKGTLENKKDFEFDYKDNFLEEFIVQYYSEHAIPKELIIPKKVDDAIQDFLSEKASKKIAVVVPKQGEKKVLLELAKKNAELSFFGNYNKVSELRKKLKMNEDPVVIECFDISHLSGTSTVASMVQFRNGRPDKSNYRRFRIRTVHGIDDFKAMAEVVRRRYKRLLEEKAELPDLIIVDGGKGQVSAAMSELEKLGLKIPLIGIAKREEDIYYPYSKFSLKLEKKGMGLRFLQEIRDEAHRFAISYNKLLRKASIK